MNPTKRSLRTIAIFTTCVLLLVVSGCLPVDGVFFLQNHSPILRIILAISLVFYFREEIVHRRVRNCLVSVSWLIVFGFILHAVKHMAFEETQTVIRYIWYIYYVLMMMIPQVSFQAALAVGEPEEKKLPPAAIVTGVITAVFILFVLTNDLHQWIFSFKPGFVDFNADYSYGLLFWIIMVWDYLFLPITAVVLFFKCRLRTCRKLIWIPMLHLAVWSAALVLLNTGNLPRLWGNSVLDFQEIIYFLLSGFWIFCVTIGLVPSNRGYKRLLQEMSLAARLCNYDYESGYQSKTFVPMTKEQLSAPGPIFLDENTIVYRRPVSGGYAYWQQDISELNRINWELEETQEQIAEEAVIIRKENEIKEKQTKIDTKSKVYDEIAVRVRPQSQKIACLSTEAKKDKEKFNCNMRLVSIYAAYIKRMSNLMLLSSGGKIRKSELALALSESAQYLNKAGILTRVSKDEDDTPIPAENMIMLYEQFETLLETALPGLSALDVTLTESTMKLTFDGAVLTLPEGWDGTAETDDGITFVRLYFRGDGETT